MGKYADMTLLSQDYFTVPEEEIKQITSLLTILGGNIVYGAEEFASLDPNKDLPISPDWSPVKLFGGYAPCPRCQKQCLDTHLGHTHPEQPLNPWSFGCDCFAY